MHYQRHYSPRRDFYCLIHLKRISSDNCRVKLTSAKCSCSNSRITEFHLPESALRCVEEVDSTDTPSYADRQHSKNRLLLFCIQALCSTCNICLTNDVGLFLFTFRGLSLSRRRGNSRVTRPQGVHVTIETECCQTSAASQ